MRYEKIILGRIRCEKAPQVVRAWSKQKEFLYSLLTLNSHKYSGSFTTRSHTVSYVLCFAFYKDSRVPHPLLSLGGCQG